MDLGPTRRKKIIAAYRAGKAVRIGSGRSNLHRPLTKPSFRSSALPERSNTAEISDLGASTPEYQRTISWVILGFVGLFAPVIALIARSEGAPLWLWLLPLAFGAAIAAFTLPGLFVTEEQLEVLGAISREDEEQIAEAVRRCEERSGLEIRVHIVKRVTDPPSEHARAVFTEAGLEAADGRGVLVLLGIANRMVGIASDRALLGFTAPLMWDHVALQMLAPIATGKWGDGVQAGLSMLGEIFEGKLAPREAAARRLSDLPTRTG